MESKKTVGEIFLELLLSYENRTKKLANKKERHTYRKYGNN